MCDKFTVAYHLVAGICTDANLIKQLERLVLVTGLKYCNSLIIKFHWQIYCDMQVFLGNKLANPLPWRYDSWTNRRWVLDKRVHGYKNEVVNS
jgi:hypothetical protein